MLSWRFVHVPKTGGISVAKALGRGSRRHVPASATREELRVLEECWGDFLFGFVRNPYDRVLSGYFFRQRGTTSFVAVENFLEPFERWVMGEGIEIGMREDKVFKPMSYYLDVPVGFIGRFEWLPEDYVRLTRILGEGGGLPHENTTEHPVWTEVYTPAMRERVYALYEEDFRRYGYAR